MVLFLFCPSEDCRIAHVDSVSSFHCSDDKQFYLLGKQKLMKQDKFNLVRTIGGCLFFPSVRYLCLLFHLLGGRLIWFEVCGYLLLIFKKIMKMKYNFSTK